MTYDAERWLAWAFMGLCATVCACAGQHPTDGGVQDSSVPPTCEELSLRWAGEMEAAATGLQVCALDSDCVVVAADVSCQPLNDVHLQTCGLAVSSSEAGAAAARLAEAAARLCSAPDGPSCASTSLCPPVPAARCVEGACRVLGR